MFLTGSNRSANARKNPVDPLYIGILVREAALCNRKNVADRR